jgi:ABC-type lipoprotein release transport system permease subunit
MADSPEEIYKSIRKIKLIGLVLAVFTVLTVGLSYVELPTHSLNMMVGMFLATIPAQIEPWFILATCLGAISLCLLAALPPAWLAARVDPAVALRD